MPDGPWINWPPSTGQDVTDYHWITQAKRAARQKAWVLGFEFFPNTSLAWVGEGRPTSYSHAGGYSGILSAAPSASGDHYVLTDAGRSWISGFVDTALNPFAPTQWDVVIEHSEVDPWEVVRTQVVGNTADTITVARGPIDDAVVAKQIPSAAALSGKRFVIVRRHTESHPSVHWHERWLEWPNAAEYAHGNCTGGTNDTLVDAAANWKPDAWAGKELMTLAGGRLRRVAVLGNTRDTVRFAAQAWAPDGGTEYAVIDPGGMWGYGRRRPEPWAWYRGVDRPRDGLLFDPRVYSHYPDDTIQPVPVAALQAQILQMNETGTMCVQESVDAFDVDLWTLPEEECDEPDRPFAPDFWKAWIRALQNFLEGACFGFVEAKSYDNLGAIPEFVTATWLKAANVNHYTRTVLSATVSGTPHVTFAAIALPAGIHPAEAWGMRVHYAILDADGVPVQYGHTYAATTINGAYGTTMGGLASATRIDLRGPTKDEADADPSPYPPAQAAVDTWVGKTIVISLGWTRKTERRFKHRYPATAFIAPDGAAPTPAAPGFYLTRPPSTRYAEYTELGTLSETGTAAFVEGESARYVGDNVNDPTTSDSVHDGEAPDLTYRDRLLEVARRPELQRRLNELRSGAATAGTRRSLTDDTKDWWNDGVGGLAGVEEGVATGGGSTSLSDSSKAGNGLWDASTGRWVGFVVEVLLDGEQAGWHKRPIAGFNQATQTLTWSEPLPGSAAGRPYRIRQPLVLNRYKGRTLRVTGTVAGGGHVAADVVITHSDDKTLYFAEQEFEVGKGWRYAILEDQPGGVYLWYDDGTGARWVRPTGVRPGATPAAWHDDPTENVPTIVTRFGRLRHGDEIVEPLHAEIYRGLNALRWTKGDAFWQPTPGDTYTETDTGGTFRTEAYGWDATIADDQAEFQAGNFQFNDSLVMPNSGVALGKGTFGDLYVQHWSAQKSATLNNVKTTRIKHAADAYVYTSTDEADLGERFDAGLSRHYFFDAQGFNVYYRRWGKIATKAPSYDSSDSIASGDKDALPPNNSPRPPAGEQYHRVWSVVGNPVVIQRWDVEGGMTYL